MTLARMWGRQLLGASGVAVLAPAAILAALGVLALSGGFGALGALGQAFSGPSIPPQAGLGGVRAARPSVVPVIAAAPTHAAGRAVRAGGGVPHAARTREVAPRPLGRGQGQPGSSSGSRGSGAPRGAGGGSGSASATGPTGGPSPGPPPSVIDRVVGAATGITKLLPDPVGTAGTQVVQKVGQTLSGIVPIRSPTRLP